MAGGGGGASDSCAAVPEKKAAIWFCQLDHARDSCVPPALVEAVRVALEVVPVVEPFLDEHVHPRQEDRRVRSRLHGQPVIRFGGRDGEAWIEHDEVRTLPQGMGKVLHLRVVHVLAEVRADEHDALAVPHVRALGRAHGPSVRQVEADLTGAAALRIGRGGDVARTVCLEQVLHPRAAIPVGEESQGLGAVPRLDAVEVLRHFVQRGVPAHLLKLL